MDYKSIVDDIVWWIPFKRLRNAVRNYLIVKNIQYTSIIEHLENIVNHNNFTMQLQMHPKHILSKYAAKEAALYIKENADTAILFENRFELLEYSLKILNEQFKEKLNDYLFLEFGVFKGESINFCSSILKDTEFYGFDSFEGLPEDWYGWSMTKSAFTLNGNIPFNKNNNINFIKGYFNDTIEVFLKNHKEYILFIHIDCDLYSSAKTIFDNIWDRIVEGTIIVFDEYFNYPNWKNHEYKAFKELCNMHNIEYKYIGFSYNQAAVQITKIYK